MKEGEYFAQFGGILPVRFLDPSQVKMYDSDGKEIMCACGRAATDTIIGKNAFLAKCSECLWEEK